MPIRHGLFVSEEAEVEPTIRFGILEIVEAIGLYPFRPNPHVDPLFDPATRFANHFDQTIKDRLPLVLHDLHVHLMKYAECMAKLGDPAYRERIQYHSEHAGMATEVLFYYWGILIDDLSRIIPYIFEKSPKINPDKTDFSKLKGMVKAGYLPIIKSLFETLDDPQGWWQKCFSPANGIRQRFTHYPDTFSLNARVENGMTYPDPSLWVFGNDGLQVHTDLDEGIFHFLGQFFEWLDELETISRTHLRSRAQQDGIAWHEKPDCPEIKFLCKVDIEHDTYLIPRVQSSSMPKPSAAAVDDHTPQEPPKEPRWWSVERWIKSRRNHS